MIQGHKLSAPRLISLSILAAFLILLPAFMALARAGGGGDYHPPSEGGYGGGGGDGGDLFGLVFALVFSRMPWPFKLIVIAIIIFAIVGAARRKKSLLSGRMSQGSDASPYIPAAAGASAVNVGEQTAELKSRDPNFSQQQFEDLASTAFFRIQEAWSKRDLSLARAFVSPTLYGRFEAQLRELKSSGRINKMDKLAVGSVEIAEAVHDGGFDYVTARINASAADYMVDEKTGQTISGSTEPQAFTEYWTFLRSDQVKTVTGGTELVSKHCPNCGAPLQVNALGKCDYCGSELTSGAFSWVLSEITQASVWRPRATGQTARPANISPLAGERYVFGLVKCPNCGANVQDIAGITNERCWRCGATVPTKQ